jgi:hypothetical protein
MLSIMAFKWQDPSQDDDSYWKGKLSVFIHAQLKRKVDKNAFRVDATLQGILENGLWRRVKLMCWTGTN